MSADQIIQNASRRLQYKDKLMGQMSNVDRCDTSATMNQQNFLRIQQQIRLQRQIIDQKTDALDEAERRIKETARNKQVFLEKWDYNLKKWEKKCSRMRADYLNAKEASIVAVDQGPMRDLANIRDEIINQINLAQQEIDKLDKVLASTKLNIPAKELSRLAKNTAREHMDKYAGPGSPYSPADSASLVSSMEYRGVP